MKQSSSKIIPFLTIEEGHLKLGRFVAAVLALSVVVTFFVVRQNSPATSDEADFANSEVELLPEALPEEAFPEFIPTEEEMRGVDADIQESYSHQELVRSEVEVALDQIGLMCQAADFSEALKSSISLLELFPAEEARIRPVQNSVLSLWKRSGFPPGHQDVLGLKPLALAGSDDATSLLARLENYEPSTQNLEEAAKLGHVSSMLQLGDQLAAGGKLPEAVIWFRRAADLGNAQAAYQFGECLLLGKGIDPNPEEAIGYLQAAAESKNGRAMDLLGVCYVRGLGVEKDDVEAVRWFQDAVDAGSPAAFYNLGARYAQGQGVKKNPKKAAELFKRGAEKGHPVCMATLAKCFESGFGLTKNISSAKKWYRNAAAAGSAEAKRWCVAQNVDF